MDNYRIGCNTLYPDIDERKEKDWTFSPQKIMGALDRISEVGYTDTEYSHIYHLTVDDALKIGEYAHKIGINSWSCHVGGPSGFDTNTKDITIESNRHCTNISSAVGARVNVLHLWNYSHEDSCKILEEICRYADEKNVEIALENNSTLKNMEFILGLVRAVDMPNLGICIDTGHANLGDLGAGRAIRMAGKKLFTTHLQDNFGKQDDHTAPGLGTIDWDDVFQAIKEIGYNRTLMLELTDAPPSSRSYNQDEEVKAGFRNVKKFLQKIL